MMMSVVLFLGRGTRDSDVFKVKMLSDVFFLSRSVVVVVDWWPIVTRNVLLDSRARTDCLEGGTHEETLRPQVNPKVTWRGFRGTEVFSRLLKDSRVR